MGIIHKKVPDHWNYFLCLESDIEHLSRWIEFSPDNESVYSIELARLLMTASAEVDVIAKLLCKEIDAAANASSINAYQDVMTKAVPMLPQAEVTIPRFGMTFTPWSNWKNPKSPPVWWTANNKVKHHRSDSFKEASLKNVLNSMSALLLFLLAYYSKTERHLYPAPNLLMPKVFGYREGEALAIILVDGMEFPWTMA